MGFFSDLSRNREQKRQARLEELDRKHRAAFDGLRKEQIRGYVIKWMNLFKQLDRALSSQSKRSIEINDYYIGGIAEDICNFANRCQDDYDLRKDHTLLNMFNDMTDEVTDKICSIARRYGYYGSSFQDAFSCVVRNDELDTIIEYLSDLEKSLYTNPYDAMKEIRF